MTILAMFVAIVLSASAQFYMHVWYNDSVFSLPVLNVDSITFTDKWLEPGEPVEPETPSEGTITIDGDNTDWAEVPMLTEPGAAGPVVKMIIPQVGLGETLQEDAAFAIMVEGDHEQILAGYPVIYVDADMSTATGGAAWYCPIFGKDYELATWSEGTWFETNATGSVREMCLTKAAFDGVPFTGSLAAWLTFNWGSLNIPAMPTEDGWMWSETKYHPFYVRPFSYAKLDSTHTAGDAYSTHRALLPGESLQLSENGNDTPLWVSWTVELKESATYNVSIDVTATNMTSIDLWLVDPATNEVVAEFVGEDIEAPAGVTAYGTWDLSTVPAGKYMLKAKNHVQWANLVFHSVSFEIAGGGTTDEPSTPSEPEAPTQGIGVFSVSADKQVTFSPGNLQYTQSTNTWSFAENQWDMIGTDNVTGGSVSSDPTYGDSKYGDALADKIDLFGWSTSTTNFGVSTSTSNSDYSGSFVDWGTNEIGNDAPNTWRTLTYDEWYYLCSERPNYSNLCGVAQVNGVNGLIFLPDNWTCPEGVTFKSGFYSSHGAECYAAYQTFTADQWSKMESAGAIFLPAAGFRNGTLVDFVEGYGRYWSATEYSSYNAYCLDFSSNEAYMYKDYRDFGHSVRLVKDVEDEPVEPEVPEVVISCAEAVAICEATGETSTTESYTIQGYVTEIKTVWSEQYGNITFWMADTQDGGQVLCAYRVKPVKAEEKNVKVGDYVEVKGTLVNYYYGTTPEVNAGGTYTILVAAEGGETPDTPVEPEEPETPAGEPLADGYAKVTNMATLADGDKVVLYCDAYAVGVTGFDGNKSATMGEAGLVEYVVETVEGGIMLKDEDQYISLTAKNSFRYNAEGSVLNVTENAMLSAYLEADGKTYLLYRNANYGNALCRMYVDKSGNDEYAPFYVYEVTEKTGEGEDPVEPNPGTPDTPSEPEAPSEGIGVFSVSADKKVTFSKGNLQYHPANNKWRFAESQLDYIGNANGNISSTYNGWIDLFGWSTSATNFGVSTSTNYNDYSGSFVDWGTNKIGTDAPNSWRTLTYDEWNYLRNGRPNASSLRGVAQVNGVNGLVFLPDNWTCPEGVTFKSGFHSSYGVDYYAAYQTFTSDQWSKLEAAGAIFLPAAGYRYGSNVNFVQNYGDYWSATEGNGGSAYCLDFGSVEAYMYNYNRYYGQSVRLVKDL